MDARPDSVAEQRPPRGRRLAPLRASLRFALDFALPPLCPACRGVVGHTGGLCAVCWSKLSFIARPYCERIAEATRPLVSACLEGLAALPVELI